MFKPEERIKMSIKFKCIMTYIFMLLPITAIVGFFSMKTDSPARNFVIILSLVLVLERICLKMEKKFFSYYYRKYLSILNRELNPEKFLRLTDREYKSSKNKKYKNYMKINYVKGYMAQNKIDKAYKYLMLVDLSNKKEGLPEDMKPVYYYQFAYALYHSDKREEAIEIYEKNILPCKDSLLKGRKNKEMRKSIKFLETLLFNQEDEEKMIQGLTESLEGVKIRRNLIERKYFLATYKEKTGDHDYAEKLYKEVIKKGNKLYVKEYAEERLKSLIVNKMEEKEKFSETK